MPAGKRWTRRGGLTLIEVMVALGVLVILVGGIFLVVQTSLKTVLMIDNVASREDEITNLTDILRAGFRNLPARARLTVQAGGGRVREVLVIARNAPGFLTWLAAPEPDNTIVVLSFRQDDANGLWRVCLKRFAAPRSLGEEAMDPQAILRAGAKVPWLELVGDFREIGMRVYDAKEGKWLEKWEDFTRRPALIEVRLATELARDPRSETATFWVPPVKGGAA